MLDQLDEELRTTEPTPLITCCNGINIKNIRKKIFNSKGKRRRCLLSILCIGLLVTGCFMVFAPIDCIGTRREHNVHTVMAQLIEASTGTTKQIYDTLSETHRKYDYMVTTLTSSKNHVLKQMAQMKKLKDEMILLEKEEELKERNDESSSQDSQDSQDSEEEGPSLEEDKEEEEVSIVNMSFLKPPEIMKPNIYGSKIVPKSKIVSKIVKDIGKGIVDKVNNGQRSTIGDKYANPNKIVNEPVNMNNKVKPIVNNKVKPIVKDESNAKLGNIGIVKDERNAKLGNDKKLDKKDIGNKKPKGSMIPPKIVKESKRWK